MTWLVSILAAGALLIFGSLAATYRTQSGEARSQYNFTLDWLLAASVCVAGVLSLGQFFPMRVITPAACVLAIMAMARPGSPRVERFAAGWFLAALAGAALVVGVLFSLHKAWLAEGLNNDLIIYFRGALWALDHGVQSQTAAAESALAASRASAACTAWIGPDCPLNRGGTFALVALASAFDPFMRASSTYLGPLLLAPLLMLACRAALTASRPEGDAWTNPLAAAGGGALAISPPVLSALANANVATGAGAMTVITAAVVALAGPVHQRFQTRLLILASLGGIGAHVYTESLLPVALTTAVFCGIGLIDAAQKGIAASAALAVVRAGALGAIAGNYGLLEALRGFKAVSGSIATGMPWDNFYLDAPSWTWLASPFAGYSAGSGALDYPLLPGAIAGALVLVAACLSRQRLLILGIIAVYAAAVFSVERAHYQYGVHKIIQLISGVSWAAVFALGAEHFGAKGMFRRAAPLVIAAMLSIEFSGEFLRHAWRHYHIDWTERRLPLDFTAMAPAIRPGDTVLVQDFAWSDFARFSRSNWTVWLVGAQGAKAVFPKLEPGATRGGYYEGQVTDTLRLHDHVDWTIENVAGPDPIIRSDGPIVWREGDLALRDMNKDALPAVALGQGWWARDPDFCWTKAPFSFEVLVPPDAWRDGAAADGAQAVLALDVDYFAPPPDGMVTVTVNGVSSTFPVSHKLIELRLPAGHADISVAPSWPVRSPAEVMGSSDQRKLFASVKSISLRSARAPAQGGPRSAE